MSVNYWLVSLPPVSSASSSGASEEDQKASIFSYVKSNMGDMGDAHKFIYPEFKIGTLDQLVVVSDELAKFDIFSDQLVNKIASQLKGLLKDGENMAGQLSVQDRSTDQYLKSFSWNAMKYRSDRSIQEIGNTLQQESVQIDTLVKNKTSQYSQLKGQVLSAERKQTGNLLVKGLSDIVKKEHFVLDSEYLETLLVVVPTYLQKQWLSMYESLTAMVVPRSSTLITADNDFCLYNVTLFKKVIEEFKAKCQVEKFQVRDFTFSTEQMTKDKTETDELNANYREQTANVMRLLKTNFGEAFTVWIHLKALRIYVESVLRYGLPPIFQSIVFKPKGKNDKKVKTWLAEYMKKTSFSSASYLTTSPNKGSENEAQLMEEAAGLLTEKEYYSFVYFPINWDPSKI